MKLPKGYEYVKKGDKLRRGDLMPDQIPKNNSKQFVPIPPHWAGGLAGIYWLYIRKISGNSAGLKKQDHVKQKS